MREARVDYSANCGNMLSAMGPFAVDEGLVPASGTSAMVRIHNTNTGKVAHAHFALDEGSAAVDGDLEIPGVHGSGAAVRLEFRDPGGAATGKLLPTGNVLDVLDVPGLGRLEASMIDAASACVFVEAASLGLAGTEMPDAIEASKDLLAHLQAIRLAASAAMGISKSPEEAARKMAPFVAFVSGPRDALSLSGEAVPAASADFTARILSNGQPHRALPLTSSLCMAVASRITGSVVNRVARASGAAQAPIRIAMPSGVMVVGASVANTSAGWHAQSGEFQRTQRRLFEGRVLLRASKLQLEDG